MPVPEAFAWSPHVALALGGLAGLGALCSIRTVVVSVGLALLVQAIGWLVLLVALESADNGWTKDWQITFGAAHLFSLVIVFPFTLLGAIGTGVLAGLVRRQRSRTRADPDAARDRR